VNPDDSQSDAAPSPQTEFEGLRKEVISLRVRGLNKASRSGKEYPRLLAIARERGKPDLRPTVLKELLGEAIKAIDAPEDYLNALRVQYGVVGTLGRPYYIRREKARKGYGDITDSVWVKHYEPQMATALTEALLGLNLSANAALRASVGNAISDQLGRLIGQPLVLRLAVLLAICTIVVALILSGAFDRRPTIQPSIVDATTGQVLLGAAAIPRADLLGNVDHLLVQKASICVERVSALSPNCIFQPATQEVCEVSKHLAPNECSNIMVPRILKVEAGDVINLRVPLTDATLTSLPFIELYVQSVKYEQPQSKLLVQITAQWPSSTYRPRITLYNLHPPPPICPPGRFVCPQHPRRASSADGSQILARFTLAFSSGDVGRLNYQPESAMSALTRVALE
jgi:hypothetical protein